MPVPEKLGVYFAKRFGTIYQCVSSADSCSLKKKSKLNDLSSYFFFPSHGL